VKNTAGQATGDVIPNNYTDSLLQQSLPPGVKKESIQT